MTMIACMTIVVNGERIPKAGKAGESTISKIKWSEHDVEEKNE
jgi:hypothetical protein